MEQQLEQIRAQALAEIEEATDDTKIELTRVKYLGRAGSISLASEGMRTLPKEQKPAVGKLLNEVRAAVTAAIEARKAAVEGGRDRAALADIDVTLPGTPISFGALHPITQLQHRA